jgi:hypothetical protein
MVLFADGRMAKRTESSQLVLWPKLMASFFVISTLVLTSATVLLARNPNEALLLVHSTRSDQLADHWGPTIVVGAAVLVLWWQLAFIRGRLLFGSHSWLPRALSIIPWVVLVIGVQPIARRIGAIQRERVGDFWGTAPGVNSATTVWIAIGIGFILAEITNAGVRRSRLTQDDFKATVWSSYPVCALSPLLASLLAKFAMMSSGWTGQIALLVITAIVTLPLAWVGTHLVMRGRLRIVRKQAASDPGGQLLQ